MFKIVGIDILSPPLTRPPLASVMNVLHQPGFVDFQVFEMVLVHFLGTNLPLRRS
jgi:hypothetical protein